MGKAQSKRSVDITTEANKEGNAVGEGTGKMGKIDDVDQLKPQVNGDTNHKDVELTDKEKTETENEKDNATEKEPQSESVTVVENGDNATKANDNETNKESTPVENGNGTENEADVTTTTLDESKVSEAAEPTEEIGDTSTPNGDKKPKKEKTKKRWSFRSFSFSKKDKQKPAKKGAEDVNTTAPAVTNGDCEKVPEETVEEAAPATEKSNDVAAVEPATNGTATESEPVEAKVEETPAPAEITAAEVEEEKPATPATPAVVSESVVEEKNNIEDVKQVAEETIEDAIVAASKSIDEKINVVIKSEVNDAKDSQQNVESSENVDQSNEKSSVDTSSNNNDASDIRGDNSTNNNPPPPLPDCPPPPQASVFAESAMTVDESTLLPAPAHPQPCPIIPTNVQSDSVLVGSTKLELISAAKSVVDEVLADAQQDVEEKVNSELNDSESEKKEIDGFEVIVKPEEIAETIAILDNVNESPSTAPNEPLSTPVEEQKPVAAPENNTDEQITETVKDDVSIDVSSPLPQNSLESLPSPQLSSLPSEADETITTEENPLAPPLTEESINVDDNSSSVPLEKPVEDDLSKSTTEDASSVVDNGNLPPPPEPVSDETVASAPAASEQINSIPPAETPTTNGGSVESSSDVAVVSDKENGFDKSPETEQPATETLNGNGEHKTIDEIVPTAEKLEKISATIQANSTEVVAAE